MTRFVPSVGLQAWPQSQWTAALRSRLRWHQVPSQAFWAQDLRSSHGTKVTGAEVVKMKNQAIKFAWSRSSSPDFHFAPPHLHFPLISTCAIWAMKGGGLRHPQASRDSVGRFKPLQGHCDRNVVGRPGGGDCLKGVLVGMLRICAMANLLNIMWQTQCHEPTHIARHHKHHHLSSFGRL